MRIAEQCVATDHREDAAPVERERYNEARGVLTGWR